MEQKSQVIFEIDPSNINQEDNLQNITTFDIEHGIHSEERVLKVRLDKWLWAARFYKTRPLARAAVEQGKIIYDGQKTIPSKEIEIGATIAINQGRHKKIIVIKGLSTRRRNLDEGQALYEEVAGIYTNDEVLDQSNEYFSNRDNSIKPRKAVRYLRRTMGVGDPK